ncbi:MAG: hypothetical protein LBL19_06930 [Spirochaetaceae bacterium]|jgi:hypothetical protein|nr:hypothetical protein [Spirochaetaceae bacterium]
MKRNLVFVLGIFFFLLLPLGAEDAIGFAGERENAPAASAPGTAPASPALRFPGFGIRIRGELKAEVLAYVHDITFHSSFSSTMGDVFSGKLNFSALGTNADGHINLNLRPVFDGAASPIEIDEAYVRAYFGPLCVEGGLRKLTWGRTADTLGPLDVINPLDYRELTRITDIQRRKIARPLVHASYGFGDFSKLEAVFIPWFEGHRFADEGRWAPLRAVELRDQMSRGAIDWLYASSPPGLPKETIELAIIDYVYPPIILTPPDTRILSYAQGGLRFTTTWASSDWGVQYYFGRLPRPAVIFEGLKDFWHSYMMTPLVAYTPYHQIGVDYAGSLAGFKVRAEFAAHITKDLSGDDGAVHNPFLAWSLGFDRDLPWGINLKLQMHETVRLLNNGIIDNPALDTEAGSDPTSTRFTGILSKKLFRDELELRTAVIWGIEDQDVYVLPGIFWTRGDVLLECSGGIFRGNRRGNLGQYWENTFIILGVTYTF